MSVAVPEVFNVGEVVFYSGETTKLPDGGDVVFGLEGTVAALCKDITRADVLFGGHARVATVHVAWLCRENPVLAQGYRVGDRVYWQGGKNRFPNGNMLLFGLQGGIVGSGSKDRTLRILFDGNETAIDVNVAQISSTVPVIPGGYECGDDVYYCGEFEEFPNGDQLRNGLKGEIVGRCTSGDASDERRVKVNFAGHNGAINVLLGQVTRQFPEIAGGFEVGDFVFYIGKKNTKFSNGDKLEAGMEGKVTGRGNLVDGKDAKRVKVRFQGNSRPVNVPAAELSRDNPLAAETVATSRSAAASMRTKTGDSDTSTAPPTEPQAEGEVEPKDDWKSDV